MATLFLELGSLSILELPQLIGKKSDDFSAALRGIEALPGKGASPELMGKLRPLKDKLDELVDASSSVIRIVGDQIDEILPTLRARAKFALDGTGEYKIVKGHHPTAKKAFEGDVAYDYQKAFSVNPSALDNAWKSANSGIPQNIHSKITGQQNSLYTQWKQANPSKKLRIADIADIEINAMKNVGIPEDIATGWVVKALEDLKLQGVQKIVNIPWNGAN